MAPVDVTGDNATTPLDVLVIINAAEREESAAVMPEADLNGDHAINGLDVEFATSALIASLETTATVTARSASAETDVSDFGTIDSISPDWQTSYPTISGPQHRPWAHCRRRRALRAPGWSRAPG